ncbi:MAG: hypothetical protein ACREH5_04585 [Candidatus Omnitrophota bacterium]
MRSWKEIPAMPAVGFKELVLATFPIKRAVKVFKTSGTTGEVHGAHFFDTLKLYEASISASFRGGSCPSAGASSSPVTFVRAAREASRLGHPPLLKNEPAGGRIRMYFLMASPDEAPHSSLSYMMGVVNRKFSAGKGRFYFKKGEPLFKELARDFGRAKEKVMILATAFSLKSFLDYLKDKKISLKLPAGSRLMETGGFKGRMKAISKKALYAECEKRLGIQKEFCFSEYGMTELSSQFYANASGVFKGSSWIMTLVIDPRTGRQAKRGQIGLLRHFDLANRGSVLAVQTEDLGRARDGGFELLGRAPGADLRGCSLSYEEFLAI